MHNDIYSSLFIVSVSKSKRLETSQMSIKVGMLSCFSCVQLFASLWTVASQALLSVGFSRQEYWSGLPFPSPGHLPWPRDQTCVSCLVRWILYPVPPGKPTSEELSKYRMVSQHDLWSDTSCVLKLSSDTRLAVGMPGFCQSQPGLIFPVDCFYTKGMIWE